jgi:hypothetical protein
MNWDAVSAIADVVGVAAVVISIFYLAVQVKANTHQIDRATQANRTQTQQSVVENFNVWRQMLAMPGNGDIWIRGINNPSDLSRDERITFNNLAGSVFWSAWFMYQMQRNEGLMGDVNLNAFRDLFRHSGLREWIDVNQKSQLSDDDFSQFLDRVRESVGTDMLDPGQPSSFTQGEY